MSYRRLQLILPLFVVLSAYLVMVAVYYWRWPTYDGLYFLSTSVSPIKNIYFADRSFHQYLSYLPIIAFDNHLDGAALVSLLYHCGIISIVFLIVSRVSDLTSATLSAILVAVTPLFFDSPTQFFSEPTAVFWGLLSLYCLLKMKNSVDHPSRIFWPILSGLCFCVSIFSKIFGLSFLPTLLWLAWEERSRKAPPCFCIGFILGLLILAGLDSYFLGDFFYHLRPEIYFQYLNAMTSKLHAGLPMRELYAKFVPHFLFIYPFYLMLGFVQLLRLYENYQRNKEIIKHIWKIVLIIVSYSLLMTASYLLAPAMPVLANYTYPLIIPVLVVFGLSIREAWPNQKEDNLLQRRVSLTLAIIFVVVLATLPRPEFYESFFYEKTLWGRIYLLVSVWIFVALLPALIFVKRLTLVHQTRRKWICSLLLSFILVWHNATWASIFSNKPKNLNRKTQSFLREVEPSTLHFLNCADLEKESRVRQILSLMEKFKMSMPTIWDSNLFLQSLDSPQYIASSFSFDEIKQQIRDSLYIAPLDEVSLKNCQIYQVSQVPNGND